MIFLDTLASYFLIGAFLMACAYATGQEWMLGAGAWCLINSLLLKILSKQLSINRLQKELHEQTTH